MSRLDADVFKFVQSKAGVVDPVSLTLLLESNDFSFFRMGNLWEDKDDCALKICGDPRR